MPSTSATFSFALKVRYTDKKVEDLTMTDKPLLAMLQKNEDFSGSSTVVPLIHVNPQGLAGDSRLTAQTNATNLVGKTFALTNGKYHGTVDIGDEVIMQSRNNAGALLQNKTAEIDGLWEQASQSLALYAWGNGGTALGRRASVLGQVITLTDQADTANFEVGMRLVASSADGSGAADALRGGTAVTVVAVDKESGTITVDVVANILLFADLDYLFRQGDFAGATGTLILKGVAAYIWSSNTPPVLYGMTRTSDPQRLAGCRVPSAVLAGKGTEERLQLLGAYMTGTYRVPGPDALFLNPLDWQALALGLQSYGIRELADDSTRFGFRILEWSVGGKYVKVYADPFAPRGTGFALRMRHWRMHSMGKLIHPLDMDGLTILRKATTDDYEYRLKSYPCLECNAPGFNGRVPV